MADLRVDNPKLTEQFAFLMAEAGVRLPVDMNKGEVGSIVDADGREVCVVDPNHERDDESVLHIAAWMVVAINTCGGFRAERSSTAGASPESST